MTTEKYCRTFDANLRMILPTNAPERERVGCIWRAAYAVESLMEWPHLELWPEDFVRHVLWTFYLKRPHPQRYFAARLGFSVGHVSNVIKAGTGARLYRSRYREWLEVFGTVDEPQQPHVQS